jgi:hypothetical protein
LDKQPAKVHILCDVPTTVANDWWGELLVLAPHSYRYLLLVIMSRGVTRTGHRGGEIDLLNFVVTKELNKNPKDYPDCKGQAHLQVALAMLKANKPVNIGDHIPYVICVQVCYLPIFVADISNSIIIYFLGS